MTASANKFDSSGKFAQDSINLDQLIEGKTTMTILSYNEFNVANVPDNDQVRAVITLLELKTFYMLSPIKLFRMPGVNNAVVPTTNTPRTWWYFGFVNYGSAVVSKSDNGEDQYTFYSEDTVIGSQIVAIPDRKFADYFEFYFGTNFNDWRIRYGIDIGLIGP